MSVTFSLQFLAHARCQMQRDQTDFFFPRFLGHFIVSSLPQTECNKRKQLTFMEEGIAYCYEAGGPSQEQQLHF